MDRVVSFGVDWPSFVDWLSDDVHDSSEGFWSDWDSDWGAGVSYSLASDEPVCRVERDCADFGVTEMLGDFEHESVVCVFDF